jgi:hypothetical protein
MISHLTEAVKTLEVEVPAVKTLVQRLQKQYTTILRKEVDRPVSDSSEIDGEIPALRDSLIAAEDRIVP